jgi:hypothetical protein
MASASRVSLVLSQPERIVPHDAVPAAGVDSQLHDSLVAAATDNSDLPDDFAPREAAAHVGVSTSRILQLLFRMSDAQHEALATPMTQGMIDRAGKAAANAIPQYGHDSPMSYEMKTAGERDRVRREVESDAAASVVQAFNKKMLAALQSLSQDVRSFKEAIQREITDFESLDSLKVSWELPDLQRIANAIDELSAMPRALSYLAQQVDAEIALKTSKRDLVLAVARKYCVRFLENPKMRAGRSLYHDDDRLAKSPHDLDDTTIAAAILKTISDFKETQRPPEIAQAVGIVDRYLEAYVELTGRPTNDIATLYYVDRDPTVLGAKPTWDDALDDEWQKRFLRPTNLILPGWSPIQIKTAEGTPVRKPGPRRAS